MSFIFAKHINLFLLLANFANSFNVDYPTFRFREYSELSLEQKNAAASLEYNERTWNQPGTADVEYMSWRSNVTNQFPEFRNATKILGFDGNESVDVWDCWINHYNDYAWDELVQNDIVSFYIILGWTAESWDETIPEPASNSKYFEELTDKEQTAALAVCYTQKLWDGESLPFCLDSQTRVDCIDECDWVSKDISRCNLGEGAFWDFCPNTCGSCPDHDDTETSSTSRFTLSTMYACATILIFHFTLN